MFDHTVFFDNMLRNGEIADFHESGDSTNLIIITTNKNNTITLMLPDNENDSLGCQIENKDDEELDYIENTLNPHSGDFFRDITTKFQNMSKPLFSIIARIVVYLFQNTNYFTVNNTTKERN